MGRARRVRVEDLPPDFDWQAVADRLDAAQRRKADEAWRRKQARHHRKQGSRRQRTKHHA